VFGPIDVPPTLCAGPVGQQNELLVLEKVVLVVLARKQVSDCSASFESEISYVRGLSLSWVMLLGSAFGRSLATDSITGSLVKVHWRRKIHFSHYSYSCEYLSEVSGQRG